MFRNNLTALFILCTALVVFAANHASAQNGSAGQISELTAAQMPKGGEQVPPASVPAVFNQTFDNMLQQGAGKIAGGEREILAWAGNFKTPANVARSISQMETNFRNAGWKYEPQGKSGEIDFFNLVKEGTPRRVVLGFFVPGDDVLVCALMEVLLPNEKAVISKGSRDKPLISNSDSSAKIVTVDKETQWVNVMGGETPALPEFPSLAAKPGKVRGYVKDWTGKPLAGAELGVRSSYLAGYYSGAQGKTDANGYYEFVVPKGTGHFYNAGYQIEWGEGVAAVSLHPTDGKLDSFTTMDGAVENFVLLPYGITSRENLQENSHLPSTFYGGAIFLSWYSAEANDGNAPPFAVREGAVLEVTLTPDGRMFGGTAGQAIVIRKTLGLSGAFRIHNIPLGRYRISVKANGKALKINDNKKYNQLFGMTPVEAIGDAGILFIPDTAKASMVGPQHGAWNWIELGVSMP
jgi:hypothetical protein